MAPLVPAAQPEAGSSREQPQEPQVEQAQQADDHRYSSSSRKQAHSRAWLAEGVRFASWLHKWQRAGSNPFSLMLALQGMLASLFHMSVFLSFREHYLVTCAVNVAHALLYCQSASAAWQQQGPGWAAGAEAGVGAAAAAAALGCPRALLPAVLGHGPRCITLCSLMYGLPLRWVLLQLVAVTAAFLWHSPDFCRHHAGCGLLACRASYTVALVAVAAAIACALTSAKQPSRFWSWRPWRHQ